MWSAAAALSVFATGLCAARAALLEARALREAMEAVNSISERAGDLDRELFMGVVTDNSLGDLLRVTIIATGLPDGKGRVIPLVRRGGEERLDSSFAPKEPVPAAQRLFMEKSEMLE